MQKGLKKYFANMDEFLSSMGLYRKMVARDASSLFRAVSEQLYYSQNYHQKIRQDCADFMRTNRCDFEPFVEGSFEKYLERLEDPKETVGQVEIKALSQRYRRCFLIYRFPGKPASVISEGVFVDKVTLCCSINGHYDIVYPWRYPAAAAFCQSLLYELLYTKVFGLEEAELCQAMEVFRVGGRRYRNSPSVCSNTDLGYDLPEDLGHREEAELGGVAEKIRAGTEQLPVEAPPPSRLFLPYKVMKSLDGDIYRNLEFDVWRETCKEMQKTDYMVFAGRQYFLGDKCQVRLEPKGKYYNAFIQEVGTHSTAVMVFIEELGEKHLVPLTDLKPVNLVPAWNVAIATRKGDMDPDCRGRHHRYWYFRKSRGSNGVMGAELLMLPPSYGGPATSVLPPCLQPAGHHPHPPLSPSTMTYDPYAPPYHPPMARPPRYSTARSSARFLNRHLISPQFTCYHPGRRYHHNCDSYAFRSRRHHLAAALNKECQFDFSEAVEDSADLDSTIAYYQLDDANNAVVPPLMGLSVAPPPTLGSPPPPSGSSYRVQRSPGPLPPAPPPGNTPVCCSSEDQEDTSTVEDQPEYTEFLYSTQDQNFESSGVYWAMEMSTNQVVKPLSIICSSPSSSPSSRRSAASHMTTAAHSQTPSVAMAIPAASPWLVNESCDPVCTMVAPPPYSYDLNGSDLPRDCRVLQYYYNLGVQWYWQQQQQVYPAPPSPEAAYTYQHYPPYLIPDPPLHAVPQVFPESGRSSHQPPSSYPESSRAAEEQTDGHGSGQYDN
ncbi:UDP-N-acetylglucosamine transferase subunit ALG13-like [Pholidichthys leucotaenia]